MNEKHLKGPLRPADGSKDTEDSLPAGWTGPLPDNPIWTVEDLVTWLRGELMCLRAVAEKYGRDDFFIEEVIAAIKNTQRALNRFRVVLSLPYRVKFKDADDAEVYLGNLLDEIQRPSTKPKGVSNKTWCIYQIDAKQSQQGDGRRTVAAWNKQHAGDPIDLRAVQNARQAVKKAIAKQTAADE